MTTIAIDLDEVMESFGTLPGKSRTDSLVWRLRNPPRDRNMNVPLQALADAIEAAADKRVIVLDPEQDGFSERDATDLRKVADDLKTQHGGAWAVLLTVAERLDGLTPPRPPEPTRKWAVVIDKMGDDWVRRESLPGTPGRWQSDSGMVRHWEEIEQPHVVSLGPNQSPQPLRGTITVTDDGRGIDVSTPWWEVCEFGPDTQCNHLDHTYKAGIQYGRKSAGS